MSSLDRSVAPHVPREAAYTGSVGRTRRGQVHLCVPGAPPRAVEVLHCVNAATDPQLASSVREGRTNVVDGVPLASALVYHDPAARRLILLIPPSLAHRVLQERAALCLALAEEVEHPLPAYAMDFEVAIGAEELLAMLSRPAPREVRDRLMQAEATQRERELELDGRIAELRRREGFVRDEQRELESRSAQLERRQQELEARAQGLEEISERLEAGQRDLSLREGELEDRLGSLRQRELDASAREAELSERERILEREPASALDSGRSASGPRLARSLDTQELSLDEESELEESELEESELEESELEESELEEADLLESLDGVEPFESSGAFSAQSFGEDLVEERTSVVRVSETQLGDPTAFEAFLRDGELEMRVVPAPAGVEIFVRVDEGRDA
ncbi:MAG: hypothetical protein OEY14_09365, partial [Myxococcales bacterium]|nr:hypothetical protein [Myxococcales bacterium]